MPVTNHADIFLTDGEFSEIFGNALASIINGISKIAGSECSACGGQCCAEIRCGLYSPVFTVCPIFKIRPRECRYHFCNRILSHPGLDKTFTDVLMRPVQELLGGEKGKIARLFHGFPDFPLDAGGLEILGIRENTASIITAAEKREITGERAAELLTTLCRDNKHL